MEATEQLRELVPKRGEAFTLDMANPNFEQSDDSRWESITVVYEGRDGYSKFRIRPHKYHYDPHQFWHETAEVRMLFGEENINLDEAI